MLGYYLMSTISGSGYLVFRLQRHLAVSFLFVVAVAVFLLVFYDTNHISSLLVPSGSVDEPQSSTGDSPMISFDSTCSLAADLRGPHQKVIGYSIYGDFSQPYVIRKYLKPFTETLKSIPIRYPGWIVRIYHNLTSDDEASWQVLNKVLDLGSEDGSRSDHIDLCNATEMIQRRQLGDIFAMTWRWLPLLDDLVDTLLSRDTDSPVFPREEDAVREWLASNETFHIMRDHPGHCRFIVGCCWGVKISRWRSEIVATAEKMFRLNHQHKYDYDQKLLDTFYQPMALKSMIAHDSYCCEIIKSNSSRPFPTARRNGLFVGWREIAQSNEVLKVPCPLKCRPQNVSAPDDWSYC